GARARDEALWRALGRRDSVRARLHRLGRGGLEHRAARATSARAPGAPRPLYSERRKLNSSCFWNSERPLNLEITALASEPLLACAWIASFRSSVRPSCRKKMR